MNFLEVLIILN
jgi:hypothetical protein